MNRIYLTLLLLVIIFKADAQAPAAAPAPVKANYQLTARFSPKKLQKIVFSTAVDAHWLKLSNRLWYVYETTDIKNWYLVDPAIRSKKLMFNNEKLAAAITLIVRDPFDAQHLPIENLKFTKDEKSIQFE